MDNKKAFREELKQTQKYLQLIGQAIANLNPDHKCLSRKDIWKFMLDYYGAEQTNEKIEYRDFLIQIRKLTGEQKLINNDGYYSLDQMVYKELTENLKDQGYLNKPIPEYCRAPSTVDRQTQINGGTASAGKRATSNNQKQVNQQVFEIGRKSANKVGNTSSVSRDQYTAKNANRRNGQNQENGDGMQQQANSRQQKINSFIKLGFDQKKMGTPKDLMQGLDPRSKYTPIRDVEKNVVSSQDQQQVNEQKQNEQPKKPNKGFGFITPAPIEKTANSGKQSVVAPGLSNSARKNKQELAEIHREAAQPEHQTEVYRAPVTSTRKNQANQYNKRQKDHGKQKLQKMRSVQHKHTISKMSKRIKKTKKTTSNNNNTTAHTVSYTQPTERQNTRSSAGQSQRHSANKTSPKKIGKAGFVHPTTQHKRDYQAAKVKVQAKMNTRAASQKVSSKSSVRKIAPQVATSQKSSARITPNKRQQVSPTKKQSSILKKSKAITKKKTTKSRSVKKSKTSSTSQSIKVNLFGTKKVTLRSSPAKKVKRSKSSSQAKKSRRSNSSDPAAQQSRISIRDNKMSIKKANEASPEKPSRSSSLPGGVGSKGNMIRRRIQPIRKNKAPYSGDREAKVKAARTMHQMYLNMGLKNKSSAIKLVKEKKLHA